MARFQVKWEIKETKSFSRVIHANSKEEAIEKLIHSGKLKGRFFMSKTTIGKKFARKMKDKNDLVC